MMKHILLICLSLFLTQIGWSQSAALVWAKQIAGSDNQSITAVTRDGFNAIISTGSFEGVTDFDPSAGSSISSALGASDAFINKFDANGNFVWSYTFGGSLFDTGLDIRTDVQGNVYGVGYLRSNVDIDHNTATPDITSTSTNSYGYVIKLDINGNFLWEKHFTGTGENSLRAMSLDPAGNIVLAGAMVSGGVDLDPDAGVQSLDGLYRMFYLKLSGSGTYLWHKGLTGYAAYDAYPTKLVLDAQNNIYSCGYFQSIIDFDPSAGLYEFNGNGPSDGFISKYDANGNFIWTKTFYNTSAPVSCNDIEIDNSGNIFCVGTYNSATDFDPDLVNNFILSPNPSNPSGNRGYLLKLDNAGNFQFAKQLAPDNTSSGDEVELDNAGNIYAGGTFTLSNDLNTDEPGVNAFTAAGAEDIFMSKLNAAGSFQYAATFGGNNIDRIGALSYKTSENAMVMCGSFSTTADLNPNADVFNLTSIGQSDAFVAKLRECAAQNFSLDAVGCGTYDLNGTLYSTSGTYTQTLATTLGCDSIITLHLTIAAPSSSNLNEAGCGSFILNGETFDTPGNHVQTITNAAGCDSVIFLNLSLTEYIAPIVNTTNNELSCATTGVYQWYECSNGEQVMINEAVSANYTPTQSGNYQVEVSYGNCIAYSDCQNFVFVGIEPSAPQQLFHLWPNPAHNNIHIQLLHPTSPAQVTLFNSLGQSVLNQELTAAPLAVSHLQAGMYVIRCDQNGHTSTRTFMKE